ncbi:MAG: lipid-A-disaccharide synthase [[Chlorobium] sp. 445]|nr:MAG: lipid-A-disaccharide synthase [[Chlorobium] sp. 445]
MSKAISKLFLVAGEASGDLHGAFVLRQTLKALPDLHVFGIGGVRLAELGMQELYRADEVNVVGFVDVAKRIGFLRRVIHDLKTAIVQEKPDAALLIDYPGMNLRLAKFLSEQGVPVIYYIAPQVWAWKENRVEQIRKYVSRLLVVFEFEVEFFQRYGIKAEFVGHPIVEEIAAHEILPKSDFIAQHALAPTQHFLGLLPGSRKSEVIAMLPPMLKAAARLEQECGFRSLLGVANTIDQRLYERVLADAPTKPLFTSAYQTMAYSDLVLVASGTATLETLLFGTPMIVHYKTSRLNYEIGKRLVKIKKIALANIIAEGLAGERKLVPELLQDAMNPETIYHTAKSLLSDSMRMQEIRTRLLAARSKLGSLLPSHEVSKVLIETLRQKKV